MDRLDAKLAKLAPDDPKREALAAQHRRETWLEDAARRVAQIQAVTHTLGPVHPDARGTNLLCAPDSLSLHAEAGSHALPDDFASDVVGNAAALHVYRLLKLTVDGRLSETRPARSRFGFRCSLPRRQLRNARPWLGAHVSRSLGVFPQWRTG